MSERPPSVGQFDDATHWLAVSRSLDGIAQVLDPIEGGGLLIGADTPTAAVLSVTLNYAAMWLQEGNQDLSAKELANSLRSTAAAVREVESLGSAQS
ncbi:hypothetical protein [Gordonia polyisoprenivorans]|uniref:hypothetical protein n=1 Tax=Gordonia polyisoprenivorans TaxID=84595 RepID=UPI00036BB19B|nr:hypothetical protein [Gordonia polyisoprenivorans]